MRRRATGDAVYARSRVYPRAGDIETCKRAAAPAERGRRTEDELLVGLAASACEVSAAHARVLGLNQLGRTNRAAEHEHAEARREALESSCSDCCPTTSDGRSGSRLSKACSRDAAISSSGPPTWTTPALHACGE